jgi:hypothetical protein
MLPAMTANRMANNGRPSDAPSLRSHPVNCEADSRCPDSVAMRHPPVQEVTSENIAAKMLCHYHSIIKDEKQVLLNHLVQREFLIGEVLVRGRRLCEPCFHLAQLTHSTALSGLIHRGGLRAQILTEGIIHIGDTIRLID